MLSSPSYDPASFRDRSGRVFQFDGQIYRGLSETALAEWEFVSQTQFLRRWIANGSFIDTEPVPPADIPAGARDGWAGIVRHEKIPFISYPYEWSFSMLRDAALLHLELLSAALSEDAILKDATPYNTQFRGGQCVFIDAASAVRYQPGEAWMGYRQFCQLMLFPLMLQAFHDFDFQPLLRGKLDGISPRQCLNLLTRRDLFRKGVFAHVFLHAKMESRVGHQPQGTAESLKQEGFGKSLIQNNIRNLTNIVERLQWSPKRSLWSDYDVVDSPVKTDGAAKEAFVRAVASTRRWRQVWDLGCNVGRYSRLCAEYADYVLALDFDHVAIEKLYLTLKSEGKKNILPLVFNLADPSPGLGWRGKERGDLFSRGRPDLVLSLALIHHLVLRENILLSDVVDWLASWGAAVVVEFVDKADPQAQSLIANRVDQYADYSRDAFEALLSERFAIRQTLQLPTPTRRLYFAEPRSPA